MAAKKQKNNAKKQENEGFTLNPLTLIQRALQGRMFLTLEFFKRNWFYVIAVTMMMLMYISNKYVCQMSMKQVMDLEVALDNARTDFVNASARYNSMIRESQMKAFVDTMHIDLNSPDQPPYILN